MYLKKRVLSKIAAIVLSLTLILSLTSCGKDVKTPKSTPTTSAKSDEIPNKNDAKEANDLKYKNVASICEYAINWEKGINENSEITTDDAINFFIYSGIVNIESYYDENLSQYYIPTAEVKTLAEKYFSNVNFDAISASILIYDSENDYFIGKIENKCAGKPKILQQTNENDITTLKVQYNNFVGEITISGDENDFKIIKASKTN